MAGYFITMQLIHHIWDAAFYFVLGCLKIATAKMLRIVVRMEVAK